MKRSFAGTALINLMLSVTLSLLLVLSAVRLLQTSLALYLEEEQFARMEADAAYLLDLLERSLQQLGYVDPMLPDDVVVGRPSEGAVRGLDNALITAGSEGIAAASAGALHGSDVIAIHFQGDASGQRLNCAGFSVPRFVAGATNANSAINASSVSSVDQGWSVFHTASGPLGEPELRCKYRGDSQWESQALISGVETFQILYGIDTDGDGLPNTFLNATRMNAAEATQTPGLDSPWTLVVAVRVALLMRSPAFVKIESRLTHPKLVELFGHAYAELFASSDPGTRILPAAFSQRAPCLRRQFDRLIFLRNSLRSSA